MSYDAPGAAPSAPAPEIPAAGNLSHATANPATAPLPGVAAASAAPPAPIAAPAPVAAPAVAVKPPVPLPSVEDPEAPGNPFAPESKAARHPAAGGHTLVNDVVLSVATSNGTGSQSANLILLRSIFNMGVPVGGKNLFPSNIQGLPTWFDIRASGAGWTGRRADTDIVVAMNAESVRDDIKGLKPGGILVLNDSLKAFVDRDDLLVYLVPFDKLVVPVCPDARLRRLVINMMYVGVVAWLLDLDMDVVRGAIGRQFASKAKAAELNARAAEAGHAWALANLPRQTRYAIAPMPGSATAGKVIMEGNMAAALGLLYGGVTVLAWYPITPSSSVCENLIALLAKYRRDPDTGKASYATVQAEDELGAMAMVTGAGWAGARAVTSTSGPGISLMGELAGLSYFAEIPTAIVNVQRMGPSTGLPTRTSQGDILKCYNLSHGDCRHVLLIPADMAESFEFGTLTLDLAERLQTLVFLMLDLDLGMNLFMTDPLTAPEAPIDRGKVLNAAALEQVEQFARYRDIDGDGVPYRTVPGTPHPKAAFFTRGTGHTDRATYTEKPAEWQGNMDRLARKFDTARTLVPKPVIELAAPEERAGAKAHATIVAYGSSDFAIREARAMLLADHGVSTDYMRIRALPPGEEVRGFIASRDRVILIEQNRDAQMAGVLRLEFPELSLKIASVLHYNGQSLDAATVIAGILGMM